MAILIFGQNLGMVLGPALLLVTCCQQGTAAYADLTRRPRQGRLVTSWAYCPAAAQQHDAWPRIVDVLDRAYRSI